MDGRLTSLRPGRWPIPQALGLRLLLVLLVLTLAGASEADQPEASPQPPAEATDASEVPPGSGRIDEFLSCELPGGVQRATRVSAADMPWRVAVGMPRNSPRGGGRKEGRSAAIAAMRDWERAIRTELPWFELSFVEKDPKAQVQIRWKRRMTGDAAGRGGPTCAIESDRVRAGGRMEISVRPCPTCNSLTVDEIRLLVAHEFGHVLGLGHCLDCDSAMNYSWETRDRVFVTRTDVAAVVRRFAGHTTEPDPEAPAHPAPSFDSAE